MQYLRQSWALLTNIPLARPQIVASSSEQDTVKRLARGDADALTLIYGEWNGPVYRFAWHMSGNTALAEEVMQETFLAMLAKPHAFDARKGQLGAYLFGIARNLLYKHMRDVSSIDSSDLGLDENDVISTAIDPWSALSHQQLVDTVRAAVVSLPMPYREAVALCDLEELSYEQASMALDCPVGTVRSRLSRGRLLLGMKLKEFARIHV